MSATDCFSHEDDARDKNGSCKQSAVTDQSDNSQEDSLYKMRGGLFGRSASYLQKESGSSQKNGANEESSGSRDKMSSPENKSVHELMETDALDDGNRIGESITELGSSVANEEKTVFANTADDQKGLADIKGLKQQKSAESGKRRSDAEQVSSSTVTMTASTEVKNDSIIAEDSVTVVSRTDGKCSNGSEGASGYEADDARAEKTDEVNSGEILPRDGSKEQKDVGIAEETPARKSARSFKRQGSHTVSVGRHKKGDAKDSQESGNSDTVKDRRKSSRKTDVSVETADVNSELATKGRRSMRTPKKPIATLTPTARVIRREKRLEKVAPESKPADEKTPTSGRISRKNTSDTATGSRSAQKSAKKETGKKKSARSSRSDMDPFSIDNNFDNHPEPLRNIQMERQSFGGYKFTKSPETPTTLRYQKTEQKANERRSNLLGLLPQQEIGTYKSLSEATLSAGRRVAMVSSSKRKTKSMGSELSEPGGSSNVLERSVQQDGIKQWPRIGNRLEEKQANSAYNFQSSPKQRKRKITDSSPAVMSKRPAKIILPELSAIEQLEADHRSNEHAIYNVGARIYALWDRLYYPARISAEPDASGRYEVVFAEDSAVRKLVATGIIPLCNLTVGRKCLKRNLKDDEEVLEEVEIVEAPSSGDAKSWMEAMFTIKEISGENTSKSPWQKLLVDTNQAKMLQVTTINTVRDVNADNIASAEERRSRAARHSAVHSANVTPTVPTRTPRRLASTSIFGKEHAVLPKALLSKGGTKPEDSQERQSSATNAPAKKAVDKIFNGVTFVVTSALRKNREGEQGFSKKEIRCMIECRGGKVIDDVMKLPEGRPIYLIADTHYRTHKYLTALARSIPCVSNQWISDCAKENKLLDHMKYMLPAGVSLLTGDMKPWHSNNGTLLSGKRVFISSNNVFYDMPNFSQIWTPIITHMGGTVVPAIPKEGLDILLTDASCTEEILNIARSQGATIVSSEWIIQAIIHGSLPAPEAHERFQYDYNDTSS